MRFPAGFRSFGRAVAFSVLLAALLVACGDSSPRQESAGGEPTGRVVLGSTTSVDDAGLLDVLVPAFEGSHPGLELHVLAVGSGQALTLGRRGDVDVVLVHAPAAESAFVAAGHGVRRVTIMRNDFVLAGPPSDPAGIRGLNTIPALQRLARAGSSDGRNAILFLSRGDSSGTHAREVSLWRAADVTPEGSWYREAGLGMGDLLRMASLQGAYTVTDRATYRFMSRESEGVPALELDVLVAADPPLNNPYSAIRVSRAPNPAGARALVEWLAGPEARALIDAHGRDRFGAPLFQPIP